MSYRQIRRKVDEITAFAELEEFIDTPIKRYSSGMQVRLGFSIATAVESDVLIVDEVLAVGDLAFQRKCFDRIEEMIKQQGRTDPAGEPQHAAGGAPVHARAAARPRPDHRRRPGRRDLRAVLRAQRREDPPPRARRQGTRGAGLRRRRGRRISRSSTTRAASSIASPTSRTLRCACASRRSRSCAHHRSPSACTRPTSCTSPPTRAARISTSGASHRVPTRSSVGSSAIRCCPACTASASASPRARRRARCSTERTCCTSRSRKASAVGGPRPSGHGFFALDAKWSAPEKTDVAPLTKLAV